MGKILAKFFVFCLVLDQFSCEHEQPSIDLPKLPTRQETEETYRLVDKKILRSIPNAFVEIHKNQGKFYIYQPCFKRIPFIKIFTQKKPILMHYFDFEVTKYSIDKILFNGRNRLKLKLLPYHNAEKRDQYQSTYIYEQLNAKTGIWTEEEHAIRNYYIDKKFAGELESIKEDCSIYKDK